jgi:3'(2'), 5'-bisphosphate nucleotidase
MTPSTAEGDHELASRLAQQAGVLLVGLRAEMTAAGADGRALKDEGDRQAHELLMAELGRARPADAVLSEEGKDDQARLEAERVWIVDPLDGTREYGEPPRIDWAVHVALVTGGEAALGAVALPAAGETLGTGPLAPALAPPHDGPPRVVVSRTRPPEAAMTVVEALDGRLVEMGSAGAKAMSVVRGESDVYVHSGGQYEWDSAAPVAVADAAGLHTSRIDGSPLVYNRPDPYLPDLLVCRPEYAEAVLGALA